MSKIVIDAREFTTSTGRYVFKLVENLQRLDSPHEFQVLLTPKDYVAWKPTNPRFTTIECPYKEFTFAEQLGFAGQLYGLRPDLVHFGMTQQPVLYLKPAVTTVHDLTTMRFDNPSKNRIVFKTKQFVYGGVIKWAARKSRALITPSNYVRDDLVRYTGVSAEKITVTYEAGDRIDEPAVPLPDLHNLQNHRFIMYVGRPTPHKNLTRLINAFVLLKQESPALKLVLAGKKDVLYERHAAQVPAEVSDDIIFTGFVSDGQLRWLYENCAAYVFPSLSEGFGLPALEAMAHGAPVASSNATCLPEVYGDAAHYFDPLSEQDMAAKIGEILKDGALQQRLIQAGQVQAAKYSWRRMAEQTLAVYDKALQK